MERPDSDPDDSAHTFLFELDDGRVIDARVRGNAARWINHSCTPNCVTFEDEDGRVFIQARRTIEPGEELTYDYRLIVDGRLSQEGARAVRVPLRHAQVPRHPARPQEQAPRRPTAREGDKRRVNAAITIIKLN